jgi:hypothetical protein
MVGNMSRPPSTTTTVPDYFQDDSPDALRDQAEWLVREIGVDDQFFAGVVGTAPEVVARWRKAEGGLPAGSEDRLREFWRTVLHLMSLLNAEPDRVRALFQQSVPAQPGGTGGRATPPWAGSTLMSYLAAGGREAVEAVDRWVTGLRFGGDCGRC